MNEKTDMIKDFLTYGNAITAFCVLQAITFFVSAATNKELRKLSYQLRDRITRTAMIWGTIYTSIIIILFLCEFILRISAAQESLVLILSVLVVTGRILFIWISQWVYRFTLNEIQKLQPET